MAPDKFMTSRSRSLKCSLEKKLHKLLDYVEQIVKWTHLNSGAVLPIQQAVVESVGILEGIVRSSTEVWPRDIPQTTESR